MGPYEEVRARAQRGRPPRYQFGDLLALARLHWVSEMQRRLEERGYAGYRRSDAATVRVIGEGPITLSRLGERLGISRQAARKLVDGLAGRDLVAESRSDLDARQVVVRLSEAGRSYAAAVVRTIDELNDELCGRVTPDDLQAADRVLRAALGAGPARARAETLVSPPAGPGPDASPSVGAAGADAGDALGS